MYLKHTRALVLISAKTQGERIVVRSRIHSMCLARRPPEDAPAAGLVYCDLGVDASADECSRGNDGGGGGINCTNGGGGSSRGGRGCCAGCCAAGGGIGDGETHNVGNLGPVAA